MSGTVDIEAGGDAGAATPHSRGAAPPPDPASLVQVEGLNGVAPDDAAALRDSQEALAQTTQRLSNEAAARRRAEGTAATLRNQAAREAQGRAAERQLALTESVAAADAELGRAKIALKAAVEAGDADGMGSAQEQIASATYRKNQAQTNLAALAGQGQQPNQRQPEPQQNGDQGGGNRVPGQRARQWLDEHPQMETDPDYKDLAVTLHTQAIRRGYTAESDAYFDHINDGLAKMYGAEGTPRRSNQMAQLNGNGGGSSAAPSNRGGSTTNATFKTARTGIGDLSYARRQDGGLRIMMPAGETLDNMRESAKLNYPSEWQRNPNEALTKVMGDYVKIHEEREGGGNAGLVMGDGGVYR